MSREDPQMKIRLPADLKDSIEAAAKASGRSMNAEIVARLDGSYSSVDSEQTKFLLARLQYDLAKQHAETELQAANQRIFALQMAHFLEMLGQAELKLGNELQNLFLTLEQKAKEQISLPQADLESITSDLENRHTQFKAALTDFLDARERRSEDRLKPPDKIILVGNIGREPFERDIPGFSSEALESKKSVNKGPQPSSNARKLLPKKPAK